ncbi:MCE family protein [Amycolatopsis regifaucium]|uniref:ABC transporter substrate-binding protein n=1 Tax=Amycolatopsis regifaucium TaxID=546365 RepID=A0A154M5P0_9PSEU|nr:MCE family protein [Amycolatopsis regifaucium]KZB79750.1 ABC transporter substrate-binding protein [Amycolatopsis regifaucium]OKA09933.1 ABC transporter substrate-binding protein [Amycolatopsis regifaucium]SFI68709.1 phospholipid/cholesterol/gamma-HCH transport system substrate-binding protein [Amycolatopsis regifaucium]
MKSRFKGFAVVAVTLAATGCSSGVDVYDIPLPGGAALGEHPIHVTASFTNVLDLVPQSGVKVNDVPVGQVRTVELAPDGRSAVVGLLLSGDVNLPANAVARLRQASILGEKFVELAPPDDGTPSGRLVDGAVIPLARSSLTPEIEEVFGALSLLLNGGGVAQVQNITRELNDALGGKESAARSLLSNLDIFVRGLDEHKAEITRAIESVNKLAATLNSNTEEIKATLNGLTPGIEVLNQQRQALVGMLKSLDGLTSVAVDTVNRSKDDLVADLKALEPMLRKLADSGDKLPKAMEMIFTFPFPDAALDALRGDYLNTFLTFKNSGGR